MKAEAEVYHGKYRFCVIPLPAIKLCPQLTYLLKSKTKQQNVICAFLHPTVLGAHLGNICSVQCFLWCHPEHHGHQESPLLPGVPLMCHRTCAPPPHPRWPSSVVCRAHPHQGCGLELALVLTSASSLGSFLGCIFSSWKPFPLPHV